MFSNIVLDAADPLDSGFWWVQKNGICIYIVLFPNVTIANYNLCLSKLEGSNCGADGLMLVVGDFNVKRPE